MAGKYADPHAITDDRELHHPVGKHADIKPSGRRRAELDLAGETELLNPTNPANPGPLHRKGKHRGPKNRAPSIALGVATTGAIALASTATAQQPAVTIGQVVHTAVPAEQQPITADTTIVVAQPKVEVTTIPAPPPPAPKVEYIPPPEPTPTPVVVVPPKPVAPPMNAGAAARQAIINAAYAQIGVWQDCTMLVTNSLRSVGIYHHGWPISYFTLGYQVSRLDALPGDLVYYQYGGAPGTLAHIAVYAGNGRAVHGGFNGNQTVEYSVDVGSGPVFIRVT